MQQDYTIPRKAVIQHCVNNIIGGISFNICINFEMSTVMLWAETNYSMLFQDPLTIQHA